MQAVIISFTALWPSYSHDLLYHEAPVLLISDTISNSQTAPLFARFTNDIFYGESGLFKR
jgi:hypothetical protein